MEKLKIQELRVGNLVLYNDKIYPVREITHFERLFVGEDLLVADLRNVSPIPLTEELLLKAGFEKKDDSGAFNIWFWHGPIDLTSDLYLSTSTHDYDSYEVGNSKQFAFIHELQNLVFDLIGQELTLNL